MLVLTAGSKKWTGKISMPIITPTGLLKFLERIESLEPTTISHTNKASSTSDHKASKKSKPNGKSKTGKWCEYHQTDTHNTSECRSKKARKAAVTTIGRKRRKKIKKAEENKTYTRKELNAILKKVMTEEKKTKSEKLAAESVIHLLRNANLTAFCAVTEARCLSRAPVMIARLWSSRSCCVHELVTLITTVVPPKLVISL
jgi:hypothetical protein